MDPKIVGKNIRQHREERHWPQEQLAMIAGVDVRTIQRAENGHKLALESLKAIANAFDTTIDELSKDSQEEALAEFRSKYSVIELTPLEQAAELCQLFGTHAYQFQRVGMFTEVQADLIAEFEQLASPCSGVMPRNVFNPSFTQLHSLELAVSVGVQSMKLRSTTGVSQPFTFSVLYVAVVPGCQSLSVLIRGKGMPVQFV